jgi:hypothetical protein
MMIKESRNIIKKLRIFAIILLFFIALNAILGSLCFIGDPSGKTIQIPIELLESTPFNDYLIPGIILFIAIGLLSLVTAYLTIKKVEIYPWFIILQGCVLIGWLTVELFLNIEFFSPILHYPFYSIGILFIVFGFIIKHRG